jgi:hypothetical protein
MNFGKATLPMRIDFYMKWAATAVLIVATALNSLGYYPEGPLLYLVEWSLIITNSVLASVNALGLIIKHFF